MIDIESPSTAIRSGMSRRTVVKGAAWSVPVIAFAGAVPAMAASVARAIEFIGVTSASGGASAALPTGWQPGDLAIWMGTRWGATAATQAPTTPLGYTTVGSTMSNKPGTFWTTSAAAYRVLQAGDAVMPASSTAHDRVMLCWWCTATRPSER